MKTLARRANRSRDRFSWGCAAFVHAAYEMEQRTDPGANRQRTRTQSTRVKSGCLTCRGRRKKCDETRPRCLNCARWHVCCTWPSFQITGPSSSSAGHKRIVKTGSQKPAGESSTRASSPLRFLFDGDTSISLQLTSPDPLTHTPPLGFLSFSPSDSSWPSSSQLLEFFILEGSRGLSGRAPCDDPFVRLALQLSLSDKMIESGILAISGNRLSIKRASSAVQEVASCHYNRVLAQLRRALAQWPTHTGEEMIIVLTASILLCFHEASQHDRVTEL